MAKPLRAELHFTFLESEVFGNLTITINSQVEGFPRNNFSAAIDTNQLFVRMQEVLSNHLRVVCNQMEQSIKQKRKHT